MAGRPQKRPSLSAQALTHFSRRPWATRMWIYVITGPHLLLMHSCGCSELSVLQMVSNPIHQPGRGGRPPAGRPDGDARPHRSTPREVGRVNQVKNTVGGPHARARTRHTSPYTAPSLSAKPPRALRAVRPASGHIGAKISLVTACQQRAISKNPTPLRHWFCHPPPTLAANEGRSISPTPCVV